MITIVMPYYDNPVMLERHLREWERYPEGFAAIIADDGSRKPALPILQDHCPIPVQLYRVLIDRPWNQHGARNLAMQHAHGWCLLTDMDHLLTAENAERIRLEDFDAAFAYRPLRVQVDGAAARRHPNSYLMTSDRYWKAGGYDEAFCGYYSSDSVFKRRLGRCIRDTDAFALTVYGRETICDASTTAWGRKGTKYHTAQHRSLRLRKRHGGPPFPILNFPWVRQL